MEIELHIHPEGRTADEILEIVDHLTDKWFSRDVAPATRRDLLFHDVLCAKQDGRTRAFLMFTSHDGMIQITLMGTGPDCHGQGFGSALLACLDRHARDLGFDEIVTFTIPPSSNPAYQSTVEFYEKRGFRVVKKYTELWRSGAWELRKAVSDGTKNRIEHASDEAARTGPHGSVSSVPLGANRRMTPQDLMRKYEDALASQKWNNIEPLVHENICVTFSTGTYEGKHEVQKAFERNFAAIKDEKYSISNLHWIYLGEESGVCLYTFQWQGLIDGQPSSGGGRGTSVLVNEKGKWKILTEHLGPHAS